MMQVQFLGAVLVGADLYGTRLFSSTLTTKTIVFVLVLSDYVTFLLCFCNSYIVYILIM